MCDHMPTNFIPFMEKVCPVVDIQHRHLYGLFTLLQIYDMSIYKIQDSIVGLTYQVTGNTGYLGEHSCELEICLKCMCHMPNVCDLVGL